VRATVRRWGLAVALGLALPSLVACEIPLPVPSVTPSYANPGAILPDQSSAILSDTFAELTAADVAQKVDGAALRIGGDAATVRAAEYRVATAGGAAPDVVPSDVLAVYGSKATIWPRVMVAITSPPDTTLTPLVLMFVQDDARSEYQLREWAHMLPGAIVPAMANQSAGFTQLPLDAPGFSMTPQAAIDAYVDGLTKGEPTVPVFSPDAYRERMFAARTALTAAAAARAGTYVDKIVARPDEAFVLQTAEGSALVLVPLTVTSVFTVPGAQLSLPAADKALLDGALADRVVHQYSDFVVLNVPKDASLLPSVVAADHHLVGVTLTEPQ
jgi:hypothetical protein